MSTNNHAGVKIQMCYLSVLFIFTPKSNFFLIIPQFSLRVPVCRLIVFVLASVTKLISFIAVFTLRSDDVYMSHENAFGDLFSGCSCCRGLCSSVIKSNISQSWHFYIKHLPELCSRAQIYTVKKTNKKKPQLHYTLEVLNTTTHSLLVKLVHFLFFLKHRLQLHCILRTEPRGGECHQCYQSNLHHPPPPPAPIL